MEQQKTSTKPISKILKFLPRATSTHVSFQNPPLYSPNKYKRSSEKPHKSNLGIGFSGNLISSENRRKTKNDVSNSKLVFEPTSPRVSCMGTVKCKQYRNKLNNKVSRTTSYTPERSTYNKTSDQEKVQKFDREKSKKKLGFGSIFSGGSRRKSDATNDKSFTEKGACLSTMKRFSSGRDAFSNFDWTTQVAPLDSSQRNSNADDEEIMIPSSAPVMVRNKGVCDDKFVRVDGGLSLEPRKEINLWKRRTMAKPQPLQLHEN